jgi:secondary thiamine-phosphate synthase enzyme
MNLTIRTKSKRQVVDITDEVTQQLSGSGLLNIFVQHTTAAVTIADLDPGTDADLLDALELMTPQKQWRHPHDPTHFPDHLWSALIGPSLTVPFVDGRLQLGSWQRLILIELDGPRGRQIVLTIST